MISIRKKNLDHRIQNFTQSEMTKLALNASTKDRAYMGNQLRPHIKFLESRGITELPNITQMFHDIGFKAPDKLRMIISFRNFMKEEKKIDIHLLKLRELKKTNDCEKNILICALLSGYSNDFMDFLAKYIQQLPRIQTEKLFTELKMKIQLLNPINMYSYENVDFLENYQTNIWEPSDTCDNNDSFFEELPSGTDF